MSGEQMAKNDGPGIYRVSMAVSTEVEAQDYADALQKGCDVVHRLVTENRLEVHTVDANVLGTEKS